MKVSQIVLALAFAGSATAFVPMAARPLAHARTVRFAEEGTTEVAEVAEVAEGTEEAAPAEEEAAPEPTPEPVADETPSPYATALGAQDPLGFWDPLNLVADADQEKFDRLRYVEIKHGRISMLAVLGQIVTKAGIRLPGDIDYSGTHFSDIGTGWVAVNQVPQAGWFQIIALAGVLELFVMKDVAGTAEFPGDLRNGAVDFGWDTFSEEEKTSKRAIELSNGRAAMMGILALMVHEQLGVSIWPGGI